MNSPFQFALAPRAVILLSLLNGFTVSAVAQNHPSSFSDSASVSSPELGTQSLTVSSDSSKSNASQSKIKAIDPISNPNQDRLIPAIVPTLPLPPDPAFRVPQEHQIEPIPFGAETQIWVKKVLIQGNTLFQPQLQEIGAKLEGKTVTGAQLSQAIGLINHLYQQSGFITSKAFLLSPLGRDGVVQIQVMEGQLERIVIEGAERINPDYIRERIAQGIGSPLNQSEIEDQLRLLKTDPNLTQVEASIQTATVPGRNVLVVRVQEASPVSVTGNLDNFSPPAIGSERAGLGLILRNLTGLGDSVTASYTTTLSGGTHLYDLNYQFPLNPLNGTLNFRYSPSRYRITDPAFANFGIRGEQSLYDVSYRQPLVRTWREELALSLGFTHQTGQSFVFNDIPTPFGFGPDANGVSTVSVVKFGQDYSTRDSQGAWSLRSQFNLGTGLFNATLNPDPIPDGQFLSWQGQVQRVQVLDHDQLLVLQGDLQLTGNTLLPSQQFVIGGGQSVRGLRQNARSGDNGFRVSVEDRVTLSRTETGAAELQVAPFLDLGAVWNAGGNPNVLSSQTVLAGGGVGLLWNPAPAFSLRLDYALPFVALQDKGNNLQDAALYFSVNARI